MERGLPIRMIVGLLSGLGFGIVAHYVAGGAPWLDALLRNAIEPGGQIFLRLLFMLVIPLIASSLVLAVAELGDLRSLGRIGLKTLAYTAVVSTIAVMLGVGLVNLIEPGAGLDPSLREQMRSSAAPMPASTPGRTGVEFIVNLVPNNIIKAMSEGDMLALMVFALLLGVGVASTRTDAARQFEGAMRGLYDVVMRLMGFVLRLAPYGVACLVFSLGARLGLGFVGQLGAYIAVVLIALAIHQFGVYSLAVWWLGGMSPLFFFRGVRTAMLTAFSTASSNATLPTALLVADTELHLPRHVSRFVLTLGSTANQNGTALFEGVTVLFLAQFFGVELALSQQILVVFICILGGIGTAGVPAGSIPVIAMILGLIGVPPEGIGIVLGVDRFLDMCRTTVNVTGDLAAAVVVSRGESATPSAAAPT